MKPGINLTVAILFLMYIIGTASASNSTVFELPYTSADTTYSYKDNIFTEFKTIDPANAIQFIKITLKPNSTTSNEGVMVTLNGNVQYVLTDTSSSFLGVAFTDTISHTAVLFSNETTNYTIFSQNMTEHSLIWRQNINSEIRFITINGKTTFLIWHGLSFTTAVSSSLENITDSYAGMPTKDVVIAATSPFDVDIVVIDWNQKAALSDKIRNLSPLAKMLYIILNGAYTLLKNAVDIGTLHFPTGWQDSEDIYNMISVVDWVAFIVYILIQAVYTYPYLIAFWILSLGNIYAGYMSSTPKDVIRNFVRYYTSVFWGAYYIYTKAIELVMWVFRIIRG